MVVPDVPAWIAGALSPEQLGPFTRKKRNASILAAAGSGKTRTLVHLVAADLAAGMPPESIVAFTFTEKAAEELLARIHALVAKQLPDVDLGGIYIGTIHAWCLKYLLDQSDYYNISSVDELHLDALVSRLYDTLDLAKTYGLPYPKAIPNFLADIEIFYNEHLPLKGIPAAIRPSVEGFLDVLAKNRLMTFGGMIRAATEHLTAHGPLADLKAVYVDEYQDVNPAQVALVKAMVPANAKVVAVGDDLQCIYQWRGSDVTRILDFTKEFPDASVHRLPTNYRSRPIIVDIANHIAEKIALRDPEKKMLPGRDPSKCNPVHWLSVDGEVEQANAVADIVERFAADGVPWNRMAVLLRSVNGAGQPFVDAFTSRGIPVICPTLSRGGAFINEVTVPVLDWLRKEHPTPHNELEEKEAEAAADALWTSVKPWIDLPDAETTFWQALAEWQAALDAKKSEAYDLRGRFYDLLNRCSIRVTADDSSMMVGLGIASQIIRSVEEIHRRRIAGHTRRTPRGVVSEVYYALIRRQKDFGESIPVEQVGDGVLVSTVHQAKGLEWPIVILPMLANRRFPLSPSPHGTSFPDAIAVRYGTSLEDERRLFYVAATRAKERLFLIDPMKNNEKRRSTFLADLAAQGLKRTASIAAIDPATWHLSAKDMEMGGSPPLSIGLSDLLLYMECPFQYGLRRIVGVEPSIGDELGYGQSLHELIQRRLEAGKPWTAAELSAQAAKHVFLPYMSESGEAKSRKSIEGRIRQLEKLGLMTKDVETEIAVEVVLDGGIVSGIIDLVHVNTDKSLHVRDWKSSVHDEFFDRYERQMQFYAHALREEGRAVADADIVDIAASAEAGKVITRSVNITDKATKTVVSQLTNGLQRIALGEFPAQPSKHACGMCDMCRICSERDDT